MRKAAALAVSVALFLGGAACGGAPGVRDAGAQGSQAPVAVHVTSARAGVPANFEVVESRGVQRSAAEGAASRTPADFTVAGRNAVFSSTFRAASNGPPLQVDVVVRERGKPVKLTAQGRVVTVRRAAPGEQVSIVSGGYPTGG